MEIVVFYSSIDGARERKAFKERGEARAFAVEKVGEFPDLGRNYAISDDGFGKIEAWGISVVQLFAKPAANLADYPFQVWYDAIDEDAGSSRPVMAKAFGDLSAASAYVQEIQRYSDGVRIKATTADAQAELDAAIEAVA